MKGYREVRVFNALHPDKNICAGGELGEILNFFRLVLALRIDFNANLLERLLSPLLQ